MRGHHHIATMRRQGAAPRLIFVDTDPCRWNSWRHWHERTPHSPQVEIEPGDFVAGLDLRYAYGLAVIVNGSDLTRVQAVGRAFERSGAARVVTATTRRAGAVCEVIDYTDTADNAEGQAT